MKNLNSHQTNLILLTVLFVALFTFANAQERNLVVACTIQDCYQCNDPGLSNQTCTVCYSLTTTIRQFPTADGKTCQPCSDFIQNCTSCFVNKGVATCKACDTGLYPNPAADSCQTCQDLFSGCTKCGIALKTFRCLECVANSYPTNDGKNCRTCGQFINYCLTCNVNFGRATCLSCSNNLVPKNGGIACGRA